MALNFPNNPITGNTYTLDSTTWQWDGTTWNIVEVESGGAGGSGATNFDALTDAATASLTIDKIYEPAIAMLRVDNIGTSAYTFPSHYSGSNPTIVVLSGTTIAFDLSLIPGKSSGVLYWRVPESLSGTYAYLCQTQAPMQGTITIKRLSTL
jgi:hypothetical protein